MGRSRKAFCNCAGLAIGCSREKPNAVKRRNLDDSQRNKCGKTEGYGHKRDSNM